MARSYWRWYRREWRVKRLSASLDLTGLNHPWVHCGADGEDWAWIAVGFGSTGADSIFHVELDFSGTAVGRFMCSVAYRWRTWRYRRTHREAVDV